jgi:subtilase family serine protease
MSRKSRFTSTTIHFLLFVLATGASLFGQTKLKQPLITQPVDEKNLVTLVGNTRPEVIAANDRGPVADDLPLEHMYLQLKRSPAQQQAVDELIAQLHEQKSPEYHRWLTADQIAERFGPADEDVEKLTNWLTLQGFTVNVVYEANGVIDFSGPASAVRRAFHTEIHNISVNGKAHIANIRDPQIPAALAPAVQGVVSMHDFRPRPAFRPRANYTYVSQGTTWQAVVPGDLATIYNINPIYAAGISGQGQTIVAIEDSDVYSLEDWYTFRQTFGLAQKFLEGSLREIHPQPSKIFNNGSPCSDPGVNPSGTDFEATLDAEWATATAPSAAIVLATCADMNTTFGGLIALQNLLTGPGEPPNIISISYEESEPADGASYNFAYNQLYEIAVLQGVSVFVGAGDSGAAATDLFTSAAMSGVNINGLASSANDVAVGGTDFADTYLGDYSTPWNTTNVSGTSPYWSSTNSTYYESALSYIPEIPWNDSCGSRLITGYLGFATSYGTNGSCNASSEQFFLTTLAGGGGPSGCAYGTPTIYNEIDNSNGTYSVVSGTCRGYAKPFYQSLVLGNPRDGVRDLPDVALFASDGIWNHYYVLCYSNPSNGEGIFGTPCVGAPSNWAGGGGTSFATPIMAGIQAMINQTAGAYQGNPNFVYYALAALEYDFGGTNACNSTLGNKASAACIFHDVTLGDNDVNCLPLVANGETLGTFNCFLDGATNGVLSLSNTSYQPAYPATPGWDFASGLGSVNAYNLLKAWPGSRLP